MTSRNVLTEEVGVSKRKGHPSDGPDVPITDHDRAARNLEKHGDKEGPTQLSGVAAESSSSAQSAAHEKHAFSGCFSPTMPLSAAETRAPSMPAIEQPYSQPSPGQVSKCAKVDSRPRGSASLSEVAVGSSEHVSMAASPSTSVSATDVAPDAQVRQVFELDQPKGRMAVGRGAGVDRRSTLGSGRGFAAPKGPPWQWFPPQGASAPGGNGPGVPVPPLVPEDLLREIPAVSRVAACDMVAAEQLASAPLEPLPVLWPGPGSASGGDTARSLEDLPRVLLLAVLSHLPHVRDVLAYGATSRGARDVASDPVLWKALFANR